MIAAACEVTVGWALALWAVMVASCLTSCALIRMLARWVRQMED